jgi:hypothetical protein
MVQKSTQEGRDTRAESRAYVTKLGDDPATDDLAETATWLATAPLALVEQFVESEGVSALANTLDALCRSQARSDSDAMKVCMLPVAPCWMSPHFPAPLPELDAFSTRVCCTWRGSLSLVCPTCLSPAPRCIPANRSSKQCDV